MKCKEIQMKLEAGQPVKWPKKDKIVSKLQFLGFCIRNLQIECDLGVSSLISRKMPIF